MAAHLSAAGRLGHELKVLAVVARFAQHHLSKL